MFSVSHETLNMISQYLNLLKVWNEKTNLMGANEGETIWKRHVSDSLEMNKLIRPTETIADLGSGNGFPGIILAICGAKNITFIERNQKKASFLRHVVAELKLNVNIQQTDFTSFIQETDVITARAVSTVLNLLKWTPKLRSSSTRYLLSKGKNFEQEMREAQMVFSFSAEIHPTQEDDTGVIVETWNVKEW